VPIRETIRFSFLITTLETIILLFDENDSDAIRNFNLDCNTLGGVWTSK
jgi:hypothetical protein